MRCCGVSQTPNFDEVNEEPVVYHWKYRLDEIDPSEKVVVDTLPIKKSS